MTSRFRSASLALALLFLASALMGCATAARRIELPLPDSPPPSPSELDGIARPGRGLRVALGKIEDVRRFPRIGERRDRKGKLQRRLLSAGPIEVWLRDSLAQALVASGFEPKSAPEEADLTVDLRLREALVTSRGERRRAHILLNAWLRCARDRRVLHLCVLRGSAKVRRGEDTDEGTALATALGEALTDLTSRIETCPACAAPRRGIPASVPVLPVVPKSSPGASP